MNAVLTENQRDLARTTGGDAPVRASAPGAGDTRARPSRKALWTGRALSSLALSCESRAEVDTIVKTALAAGGKPAMDPQDHGFMYGWSFYDLDGHHWEVVWMDPNAVQ
jgi:hypothetical protein